jgi:TRAP-type C4-dicarboxylate transport system substrate-binding protein
MKKARIVLCVLLCLVMAFTMTACGGGNQSGSGQASGGQVSGGQAGSEGKGGSNDTVYEIDLSLSFPEPAAGGILPTIKKIEGQSNGRIKFNIYYSYSLVNLQDLIDGLQSGIVDMATIVPYEYKGVFPLNGSIFGLPFMGYPSIEAASKIYREFVDKTPELKAEYENAGLVYLTSYMMPGYNLHMAKANCGIRVPSDLKGYKLICGSPEMQQLITDNQGAPLFLPPTDYFSTLEKGVADGLIAHMNVVSAFGCAPELTKTHIQFSKDPSAGAYQYNLAVVFSEKFWNSLPEDLQKLFLDNAEQLGNELAAFDQQLLNSYMDKTIEAGNEVIYLTDEQAAEWEKAMEPTIQSSIKALADEGYTYAEQLYKDIKETVANYK